MGIFPQRGPGLWDWAQWLWCMGPMGGGGSCPTWPTGAADFFSVAGNEAPREETCTGSFSQHH